MSELVNVGISDLNVVKSPNRLITYALGSCVGICLYDSRALVAGLSHIMLPYSKDYTANENICKFADTAIPKLLSDMEKNGASRTRIVAKIAGGAQMFNTGSNSSIANIGQRNVAAVKEVLKQLNIKIVAEDTGLNYGRTVEFSAVDGIMTVKSVTKGISKW
ncbi:MAG TPA: chemotaxis protein CheD [Ruminococcaceae bacterium]|nr:chemotaxis protein CheD [Oscillospiraceae bacterium]